jgi:hypothetical protein
MLMAMVYTMTSSIGAHIYTLHNAHGDGIHDGEFDRCAYIRSTYIYTLRHHTHANGIHDDEFARGTYTYTTSPYGIHDDKFDRGAYICTHYTMLTPMIYTMTSSIGAHIYTHYIMLMQMVYTMTSSIGAHIYRHYSCSRRSYTHDVLDDGIFDRRIYTHYTKPQQMV